MNEELRKKILALLEQHRVMTIATLRPDGWPQATTVGYVNEGLTLYFLCGLNSQKAENLARDDRVSLTIDHDTPQIMEITGLSMAARAQAVFDRSEAEKVLQMLPLKYPEQVSLPGPIPAPEQVRIFRVTPTIISVLDYTKGFGHADLVRCYRASQRGDVDGATRTIRRSHWLPWGCQQQNSRMVGRATCAVHTICSRLPAIRT